MPDRRYSAADVTIAVLNYNGMRVLPGCLQSLRRLRHAPGELLLIDDGSSDGSPEWVEQHCPQVRVVRMGRNTKRLNSVRNRGLIEARLPLVMLVDNDITLAEDCLEELLDKLCTLPDAAVCMPRVLYAEDASLIYYDGQHLHYVGATYSLHRDEPAAGLPTEPRLSIGCGMQLITREKAAACGNFNEAYVMGWGDDGEFNFKLNLAGMYCYHVPTAAVQHHRTRPGHRYYGTVRNRGRFLLECYQWRTLILGAPAFLAYEVGLIAFLASEKALGQYLRAMGYVLTHIPSILKVRRGIQRRRRIRDSALMTNGPIFIRPEYINSGIVATGLRALNGFVDGWWRLIQRYV